MTTVLYSPNFKLYICSYDIHEGSLNRCLRIALFVARRGVYCISFI